jgi:hypothetical protein
MTVGLDSVVGIRVSLNADETDVRVALAQLVETGLVKVDESGERFVLTRAGADLANSAGMSSSRGSYPWTQTSFTRTRNDSTAAELGWREISGMVAEAWDATQSARAAKSAKSAELERTDQEMLVGDVEREAALSGLSQAYGDGRLTQAELDRRTDLVLHARTRGDLDVAYDDLPRTADRQDGASPRSTTFAVAALLSLPVVVLGLLLLGADETGGKLFGAVLLVVPVLSLLVLGSWAFPRGPGRVRSQWRH